jgi:hypothetical protein
MEQDDGARADSGQDLLDQLVGSDSRPPVARVDRPQDGAVAEPGSGCHHGRGGGTPGWSEPDRPNAQAFQRAVTRGDLVADAPGAQLVKGLGMAEGVTADRHAGDLNASYQRRLALDLATDQEEGGRRVLSGEDL